MRINTSNNLSAFINKYAALHHWKNSPEVRLTPRQYNQDRLGLDSFCVSDLLSGITAETISHHKYNLLFAHFSPLDPEMEALGLPLYASKVLPNSKIHFTYDKGGTNVFRYEIQETKISPIEALNEAYDIIIGRSAVFNTMKNRPYDSKVWEKSGCRVNIKTMSYAPNLKNADYYFEEEDMCPPASPDYVAQCAEFLSKHKKENIILVSGTMWYVKNQLQMIKDLDETVCGDYVLVFMGPLRDVSYVKDIISICEEKKIDYFVLGQVNKKFAREVKYLSKISVIPMDMRAYGQPKGYPRTLGESIAAKCITLCNKPVTVPSYYQESCLIYDEGKQQDLNKQLKKCIDIVKSPDYINTFNWGSYSMEDHCEYVLKRCLKMIP